jgi:hypothetical protein
MKKLAIITNLLLIILCIVIFLFSQDIQSYFGHEWKPSLTKLRVNFFLTCLMPIAYLVTLFRGDYSSYLIKPFEKERYYHIAMFLNGLVCVMYLIISFFIGFKIYFGLSSFILITSIYSGNMKLREKMEDSGALDSRYMTYNLRIWRKSRFILGWIRILYGTLFFFSMLFGESNLILYTSGILVVGMALTYFYAYLLYRQEINSIQ